jgi:hypothetical protein
MPEAIGRPGNGIEPPFVDGLPIHAAGAECSVVEPAKGLSDLAERRPVGIAATGLLILLFVHDAFVARIADGIIARFASPLPGSCKLAQQCLFLFLQLSLIPFGVHASFRLGGGSPVTSMREGLEEKD